MLYEVITNGILLVALACWIVWEAIHRLLDPAPVLGGIMLWIAAGGLVVNILAAWVLHGGDQHDLNLQGALWHVIGDLLGSVAAIAAAIIILATGWMPADPLLSMLVAILVLVAGIRIARQSGHILLEGTPEGLSRITSYNVCYTKLLRKPGGRRQLSPLIIPPTLDGPKRI